MLSISKFEDSWKLLGNLTLSSSCLQCKLYILISFFIWIFAISASHLSDSHSDSVITNFRKTGVSPRNHPTNSARFPKQ